MDAEPGVDEAALDRLEEAGWTVRRWEEQNLFFGGVQAVARNPETGELSGGGDPRRGGVAAMAEQSVARRPAISRAATNDGGAGRAAGAPAGRLRPQPEAEPRALRQGVAVAQPRPVATPPIEPRAMRT